MSVKQKQTRFHATAPTDNERFRELLDLLGLSQRAAGRFLGLSTSSVARMALGLSRVSPATAMLLEVLVAKKITPDEALKLIGVNVRLAEKAAREQQPNKQPRFFE
jgi:transcriptional regulator with XRE-family HTH domain